MSDKPTVIISGPIYQQHDPGPHPERPARTAALHALASQLVATDKRFTMLAPERAALEKVTTVHLPRYVQELQAFCEAGGGQLDINTTLSPGSFEAALHGAGGLLQGVDAVLKGEARNAFALVRPPGHHAVAQEALGFCLFNNVAIAARYLLDEVGLERILIVDWDVHHGNGTQDAFYDDPRVLFFSSHQYPLYPGTGDLYETGQERGRSYNINLPLPAGCGDAMLERAFDELLEPLVARFKPQFVLVSAGYDGHWRDPLAHLRLSAGGYARLTHRLLQLADTFSDGRLALTLEGGYDLTALTTSVEATLLTLAGSTPQQAVQNDPLGNGPGGHSPEAEPLRDLLRQARQIHKI